jgi:hypothetical protein
MRYSGLPKVEWEAMAASSGIHGGTSPPASDGAAEPATLDDLDSEPVEPLETDEDEDEDDAEAVPDEEVEVIEPTLPAVHSLPQPVHSTRSETPGPRGCWAISKTTGEPCGAAKRNDSDYCNAHAGYGVSRSPTEFSSLGVEKRKENATVRAQMRVMLGITRSDSPRALLRARVFAERERVVAAAVDGAKRDGALALKLINAVDPPLEASVSVAFPTSAEQVEQLSLSELRALAEQYGISRERAEHQPIGLELNAQSE